MGPAGGGWTEEKIRALLASEPFNYQAIDLPYGISTGGYDRQGTADQIFAGDWSGQSVLDVGCSLGYFLFEARRRGAGRAAGMDLSADNVRRGRILSEILQQPVEFRVGDIDNEPVGEVFDNVLCLNVLHHLTDPILGLNRLIDATRRRLVLEVATVGSHDRRKLGLSWLQSFVIEKLPVLFVGRGTAGEGIKQFYLTISAIENLLRFRRGCFASVTVKPSDFKNRFLVIAEKRQIGHLVVVGGPAGSGAQSFIDTLTKTPDRKYSTLLGTDVKGATVMEAANYHVPQTPHLDRLVLNYDLMRPTVSGAMTYDHDPALDAIETASKVTFLTLWVPPAVLKEGAAKSIAASLGRAKKRLARAYAHVADEAQLVSMYRNWIDYTASKGDHWIVSMEGNEPKLFSPQVWQQTLAAAK